MPYNRYGGPEDYYGPESGFDPYSGRLNGGQLVMQFLARMQAEKDRAQKEVWGQEDREYQSSIRPLEMESVRANIEQSKAATESHRATTKKAFETKPFSAPKSALLVAGKALGYDTSDVDGWSSDFQEKVISDYQDLQKKTKDPTALAIKKQESDAKALVDLEKAYRTQREKIEAEYTKSLSDIEKTHGGEVADIRADKTLAAVSVASKPGQPSAYTVAMGGANFTKERRKKELAARIQKQIENLDAIYERSAARLAGDSSFVGLQPPTVDPLASLPKGFKLD